MWMERERRCRSVWLGLLLGVAFCKAGEAPGQDWQIHRGPMGFELRAPGTWAVKGDPASGRILLQGGGGEELVIWPAFVTGTPSNQVLGELSGHMSREVRPDLPWGEGEWRGGAVTRSARQANLLATSFLWSERGRQGTALLFCSLAADEQLMGKSVVIAVEVLESLRLFGEETKAEGDLVWTTWRDPTERAFSVQVPSGWTVQGGVIRPNSILAQAKVELTSPDQEVYVFFGDTFPWYVQPNNFVPEGGVYTDIMGGQWPVRYYAPGARYLALFLLPQRLHGFQILREQEPQEVAVRLGMGIFHAGEMDYAFSRGGRDFRGRAACITRYLTVGGGLANWYVYRLALAEAPRERLEEATSVAARLVSSLKIDPYWLTQEAMKAGVNSEIISQMNETVNATIAAAYKYKTAVEDAVAERGARARREIVELEDTLTGERFEVQSGSRYYWVDQRGNIVGTETHTVPTVDFRELLRIR